MKRLFYFIFFTLFFATSFSQSYDDMNAVATPSPNNNFLGASAGNGVDLYSGKAQISIPIYSLASKSITIPISLSYVGGGGIKIQDVSNSTGLGWRLNAGGNISRVVRGIPDEQAIGYIGTSLAGQTIAAGLTNDLINKVGSGQLDGEPDLFTISTPFFSAQFVFDQNGNPVFSNNSGLKIIHNLYNNYDTQNTSWTITDDNGNQYFFGSTSSSREGVTTKLFSTTQTFTSTWYLDRIITFNAVDNISFNYSQGPSYTINEYSSSQNTFTASGSCGAPNPISAAVTQTNTYVAPKYLNKIISSLGEVDLNYQNDRQDISNFWRLSTIAVYPYDPATLNTTSSMKTFQFNYSYLGNTADGAEALRMELNSIYLYGNSSDDPPLTLLAFDYNTANNLPPRTSVEFDYWGYYNVNASGTAIVPAAIKTPDQSRAMANILTAVHTLSGETDQFQYELNSYYDATNSLNTMAGGVRVKQITKSLPSGESLVTQYVYTDATGKSTGQIYNSNYKNFVKTYNVLVPNGTTPCVISSVNTASDCIYYAYDLNGASVGYSSIKVVSPNGGYETDQFTNFSDFPDVFNYSNNGGITYSYIDARQLSAATSFGYKRGLLLDKTEYTAGGNKVNEMINSYASQSSIASNATGIRATALNFVLGANIQSWIYGVYATNVENYLLVQTNQRKYDQNNPVVYQERITHYIYAPNKRLIHEVDYVDSKGVSRSTLSYYPEDNNIPSITTNEQYAVSALLQANNTNTLIHTKELNNGSSSDIHYTYLNFTDINASNKSLLAQKRGSINGNTDGEHAEYQYDINTAKLSSANKAGGPFQSFMYGYNNSYLTAKVQNAVNTSSVVLQQGFLFQGLNFDQFNMSQSTSFTVGYSGNVTIDIYSPGSMLSCVMDYNLSGPVNYSGSVCISIDNSCVYGSEVVLTGVPPGNYTLNTSVNNGSSLDPIEGSVSAGVTYPALTGYANINQNEFYYEGFEQLSTAATTTPFAGKRYQSGVFVVPFQIPNARSYQVDYHYLLNGKWYANSKPFQNNMTLSDGSAIDEVRVYPTDAEMTTYTYDPLYGVTSEGDTRNRFSFYEYDHFGRLKLVRDNDGNILKYYSYEYQVNAAQTCPAPVITSLTSSGLTLTFTFIASFGSGTFTYSIYNQARARILTGNIGRVGVPVTVNIPTSGTNYTVTVGTTTLSCPLGVSSDPKTIAIP